MLKINKTKPLLIILNVYQAPLQRDVAKVFLYGYLRSVEATGAKMFSDIFSPYKHVLAALFKK